MMEKSKCLACKKKKVLVERSDYCSECYEVEKQKIENAIKRLPRSVWGEK